VICAKSGVLKFIGFLSKEDFFVYAENGNESVIDYFTVNMKTGEIMRYIPMFHNRTGKYYAYVHFQDFIGDLYLEIKIWEKDGNALIPIYDDEIKLCDSCRNENFRYELSNLNWQNTNTFMFNLSEKKETVETVNVRIEIFNL